MAIRHEIITSNEYRQYGEEGCQLADTLFISKLLCIIFIIKSIIERQVRIIFFKCRFYLANASFICAQ